MSFLRRVLAFFVLTLVACSPVEWADGRVDTDPRYAVLYADVVRRIEAVRPDAIQAPVMGLTVRLYDNGFPAPDTDGLGKVLAPNVIPGDTGGTLCLRAMYRKTRWLIQHEQAHAITGIPDHPLWLFKRDGSLNV